MPPYLGKNVILYLLVGASPYEPMVIGCARNTEINYNTDTAEKTTIGSGTSREYKPLSTNWSGTIDGLSGSDNVTVRELMRYVQDLTVITMQFNLGDDESPLTGDIIITGVKATGNYNDAATFNMSYQGTGILDLS